MTIITPEAGSTKTLRSVELAWGLHRNTESPAVVGEFLGDTELRVLEANGGVVVALPSPTGLTVAVTDVRSAATAVTDTRDERRSAAVRFGVVAHAHHRRIL